MNKEQDKINFVHLPEQGKLLEVQPLDYPNPYDFKKLHRHNYFEIILVNNGTGSQLIDFTHYPMAAGQIFMIYPGQVHLMNRDTTQGMVIQFKKNVFEYIQPLKHHDFYNKSSEIHCHTDLFEHLYDLATRVKKLLEINHTIPTITYHKAFSYLQVILISLIELQQQKTGEHKEPLILAQFISLITENINDIRKVAEYAELMNCSADKLNEICKKGLGKTALEIIHEELLLEIRRLLILNELSLKEIAYKLNFDTQGNFNAFVKTKTKMTPKQLQKLVLQIYN